MAENQDILIDEEESLGVPLRTVIIMLIILAVLAVFAISHFSEAKEFFGLVLKIDTRWLLLAIGFQLVTYVFAGSLWGMVTRKAKHAIPLKTLATLAVEQLTIDQVVPAGGIAGNAAVLRALHRMGVPAEIATEVIMIDILAYHIAYSSMTLVTVLLLWLRHGVTPLISGVVTAYFIISIFVTALILFLLYNRIPRKIIPNWLKKNSAISMILKTTDRLSAERVLEPSLLVNAAILRIGIFFLDIWTLWVLMQALHDPVSYGVAFAAFIIASIAGTVSFMPGGLGGFEVACVAVLLFFKVSPEAAISSTLVLRGLTLWIPLLPGLYFARHHLSFRKKQKG